MSDAKKESLDKIEFLKSQSTRSRLTSLEMAYKAGMGHIAPDFSCLDIITVLYFSTLRIDPANPQWNERDRFILSKGHAAGALYVTLAARGFFKNSWLKTYQEFKSKLLGHPDRHKIPGVEHNTGALGHGLSVATGMATALRHLYANGETIPNVFVLLGDGELQEGSNWEAMMLAAHLKLANLTAIVDHNGVQQGDFIDNSVSLGDLTAKWRSFGWDVLEVEGHDHEALVDVLTRTDDDTGPPRVVIANTIKGRGISFMENNPVWHHKIPSRSEYDCARAELQNMLVGGIGHD